jgi:hypothetical protein
MRPSRACFFNNHASQIRGILSFTSNFGSKIFRRLYEFHEIGVYPVEAPLARALNLAPSEQRRWGSEGDLIKRAALPLVSQPPQGGTPNEILRSALPCAIPGIPLTSAAELLVYFNKRIHGVFKRQLFEAEGRLPVS